jgi:LPS export ABC transporter protein LptC
MSVRAALAALAVLSLLGACKRKGSAPPVAARASMADSAEQVMLNIRALLTDHGVQRGELFADTAYVFDQQTRFELRKVRATFNTTTGAKDGVMSADRGRYSLTQQLLEGFGNVVIVSNEGKRLTTPQLRYNQALNEVSSDTTFNMVEPGRTLNGIGFRSDPQLTRVQILRSGNARGSITLPAQ